MGHFSGLLHIWKKGMRTTVYIDGFNLYYSALKNSRYKWLDPKALCERVLASHNQITKIKYFTAFVSDRADNTGAVDRQKLYLRALSSHIPQMEIIRGHFSVHCKVAPIVTPGGELDQKEVSGRGKGLCTWNHRIFKKERKWKEDPGPKLHVINTEEKGSDVNLAVHMVNDGWKNQYDCCCVVSNDSDLAEPLKIVSRELGKTVGLISTWRQRPVHKLKQYCTFVRTAKEADFAKTQLPSPIGTKYFKPQTW